MVGGGFKHLGTKDLEADWCERKWLLGEQKGVKPSGPVPLCLDLNPSLAISHLLFRGVEGGEGGEFTQEGPED